MRLLLPHKSRPASILSPNHPNLKPSSDGLAGLVQPLQAPEARQKLAQGVSPGTTKTKSTRAPEGRHKPPTLRPFLPLAPPSMLRPLNSTQDPPLHKPTMHGRPPAALHCPKTKSGGSGWATLLYSDRMQYICAHCGCRPEEIIGHNSPRCLRCGKPMVRATLSYKGLWMSPSFVIQRMQKIIETHGIREAQSSRRFKQEREAWATAAWSFGLM
jgi:DNA-directed RNA polymerase subunit RPC12/RpoP